MQINILHIQLELVFSSFWKREITHNERQLSIVTRIAHLSPYCYFGDQLLILKFYDSQFKIVFTESVGQFYINSESWDERWKRWGIEVLEYADETFFACT